MYLFRNVTGYWKAKQYKRNLRTDISGSTSQDNIQTRAFTNSTNRLLIKFDILLYDKHHDVTVTLLMIGLPSYIRVSYEIQVVDSNFHLPWKAFRIRSNRYLNIFTKTKKRKEAPCSSACVSSGSLPGSSDILFEQHINCDNVLFVISLKRYFRRKTKTKLKCSISVSLARKSVLQTGNNMRWC